MNADQEALKGCIVRLVKAVLRGMAAFLIAGISGCFALTEMVANSHDGQAGMGAAFGGFYLGVLAAVITFIVSLVKSSPSRRKN